MKTQSALNVQLIRGAHQESEHWVDACVVDASGNLLRAYGNPEVKCFPRSAIKPIQALAIVRSGADKKFNVTSREIAVACASHHGEAMHVEVVDAWLKRMGLSVADLECGTHGPYCDITFQQILKEGQSFSAIHNNCSGKHTGFLATALALGVETKNYLEFNHPVQKLVREITNEFCQVNLKAEDAAIDGCGIPTFCFPLHRITEGFARFSASAEGRKILKSALMFPHLTSGTGEFTIQAMEHMKEKVFVKVGAEGLMGVYFPEENFAICVKARDGAGRAAEVATAHILKELGFVSPSDDALLKPKKTNWAGREVAVCKIRN